MDADPLRADNRVMDASSLWIGEAYVLRMLGRRRDHEDDVRSTAVLVARVSNGHVERFDRFPAA